MLILITLGHKVFENPLKSRQLIHAIELPENIGPGVIIDPVGGVILHFNFSRGPRQQIPPLIGIHLLLPKLYLHSQHKRKEQLMLLKQRPTHILVQTVSEVVYQIRQPYRQLFGGQGVLHRHLEEVDEPLQRVLVHRVDAGQVHDAEE
jgi:hypothetical protein